MSVYVDPIFQLSSRDPQAFKLGKRTGHKWCHMFCDPISIGNLHMVASRIGMRLQWFQNKPGFPHYDLTPSKRVLAVNMGVKELTREEFAEFIRKWKKPIIPPM